MPPKSLFTAIKESKSPVTKKTTIEIDVQGYKGIRTFLVSNLMDWYAIIGYTMLHHLNTVMNVKDYRVSIQTKGKMRYDLNMLDRVTETPVMQVAATYTQDYDSAYDSPISDDSSWHAHETDTDEDTTDSSTESDEDPALLQHTSANDSQGRPQEQGNLMLDETRTLHPWLDCDSGEDMIAQAQTHWSYYADIDESQIEENDSDYNNIKPSSEVWPDTIVTNAVSTLVMYDPVAGFPALFPEEKPTELPTLREQLEIMQHTIDVIPNSVWKLRFPSTYNKFKDQITKKIITQSDTGRIVPYKSSNSIGMFTEPKRYKP